MAQPMRRGLSVIVKHFIAGKRDTKIKMGWTFDVPGASDISLPTLSRLKTRGSFLAGVTGSLRAHMQMQLNRGT